MLTKDQGTIPSSNDLKYFYIQTRPTLLVQLNTDHESSRSVMTFENNTGYMYIKITYYMYRTARQIKKLKLYTRNCDDSFNIHTSMCQLQPRNLIGGTVGTRHS